MIGRALCQRFGGLSRSVRHLSGAAAAANIASKGEAQGMKFYQFSFVDVFGVQRSKLVPASRVAEIAEGGAGFAGFAAHLDMDPTMGDLLAVPDPETLTALPWNPEVGWLSCNLVHEDVELAHGPRNVLRKVTAKLAEQGLALKTGVECEFFIIDPAPSGTLALADSADLQSKPCYDAHALMRRYELISTLVKHMEALGWGPYQADHEDANGQFEINWDFNDALVTADRVTFFKYMVRSLAEAHGLRATFMPKPFANLTGSGCHAHLSLHDLTTGANVCGGGDAAMHNLSPIALNFLSGLLSNAPALTALTNPTVNSYKRLNARGTTSGATWSPTAVTWAGNNRTALIRVPGKRMELRLADMSANPYLMAAGIGAAGLDGVLKAGSAPPPTDRNMYDPHDPIVAAAIKAASPLPKNLLEALDTLDGSSALRTGLGNLFVDSYLKLRRDHWDDYANYLSPWELQAYLDS
mmetsp:Transcript_4528/g.11985  ORF Transcript_4528/g.11985 Transcript_4528/m.11985 type:complete len:468 (+) Transcript_4528:55-1458(+)